MLVDADLLRPEHELDAALRRRSAPRGTPPSEHVAGVAVDPGLEHDGVAEELGRGAVDRAGVDLERAVDLGQQAVAHHGHLVGEASASAWSWVTRTVVMPASCEHLGHGAAGRDPQPRVEGGERTRRAA